MFDFRSPCFSRMLLLTIALAIVIPGVAFAQTGTKPHHLRVVWHEDPAHEAIVSWTTREPAAHVRVHYDRVSRPSVEQYRHQTSQVVQGAYEAGGAFFHHARLSKLEPSTAYWFRVESDGELSRELYFVTAPADEREFKLLYGGDSRSDPAARRRMNRMMAELMENDPSIVGLVHGGDYIGNGSNWRQWDQWLRDHSHTIARDGRMLPIVPARGNHETDGVIYNEVFGFPGGPESNYWTTRFGSDAVLITLDTNASQAGDQRAWLEQQLKKAQKYRWILVNYHRPAYPAVKSPGGALEHWVPLFERYNVDVVCESDGHVLKRTVPIRNGQMDPTGIVYIGEGGLGVPQRTPKTDRWYLQEPGMATSAHHVQVLTVRPDALEYEARLLEGGVADRYTFEPRREGNYRPLRVVRAALVEPSVIEVKFSKPVDEASALELANYRIEPDVPIRAVTFDRAKNRVLLDAAKLPSDSVRLRIERILDRAGKAMEQVEVRVPYSEESERTSAAEGAKETAAEGSTRSELASEEAPQVPAPSRGGMCAGGASRAVVPVGFVLALVFAFGWTRRRDS